MFSGRLSRKNFALGLLLPLLPLMVLWVVVASMLAGARQNLQQAELQTQQKQAQVQQALQVNLGNQ